MKTKFWEKAAALGLTAAMSLSLLFTNGQPSVIKAADTDSGKIAVTPGNPVIAAEDGKITWDCVWFGNYWQQEYKPQAGEPEQGEGDREYEDEDGTKYIARENGQCYKYEPVKWRVLSVSSDGRNAFLLADQCLEARPYHTEYSEGVTWETCALREWLNETFMQTAFTGSEQEAIVKMETGNISLPSLDDMLSRKYGFADSYDDSDANNKRYTETETRIANSSDFARSCEDGEMSVCYLLRTLAETEGYVLATNDGAIPVTSLFGTKVDDKGRGIRPVLYLDLSKTDVWSYAGQVKQDRTEIAPDATPIVPFPTPTAQPNVTMAPGQVYPKNPVVNKDDLNKNTWDCIYFGRYQNTKFTPSVLSEAEQHDTMQIDENGEYLVRHEEGYFRYEPIKWRVLSINGTDAFVMADQVIDAAQYYSPGEDDEEITWETSDLRMWLNDSFIKSAFTESEINIIKETVVKTADNRWSGETGGNDTYDRIYLPSIEEMLEPSYGFSSDEREWDTRRISVTDYAKAEEQLDWVVSDSGTYWLRSAGPKKGYPAAVGAWGDGVIQTELSEISNKSSKKLGVRPVMHVDLSDTSLWTYAGQVTPQGVVVPQDEEQKQPTPSPGVKKPGKPAIKKLKNSKGKKVTVILSKKVSGATGYQAAYAVKSSMKGQKTKLFKGTSVTVKGLKKKKTYYFRVRAYTKKNGKTVYGNWSSKKSIKIKK